MNEEEILDIKRENYRLRKENFELIQDNNKLQEEKDILNLKLREEICKSACNISKIKTKIRDKIKELEEKLKYIGGCDNDCKKCFNSERENSFEYCFAYHQIKVLKSIIGE